MKKIVLFDIDYTIFDTDILKASELKQYELYQEVRNVLDQLKEIADLGIFSQGEIAFQKKKLSETNIETYFLQDKIHIIEDKETQTKGIMDLYSKTAQLYIVEDRLPILQLAEKYHPNVKTIWVKRGIYAEQQLPIPGYEPDITVTDLYDIVAFIKNN